MKKYKLFAFTFIIAILSMVTVNAREMTIEELGQAAMDLYKDTDKDVGYIYVIGEYAFTSQYDIKTEDIMLAANSIEINEDAVKFNDDGTTLTEDYQKMVINTIRAQVDDDFNVTGWYIATAAVGTTNITKEEKFNVRFIDYAFQAEKSSADIKFDKATEDAYQSYLNSGFGINDVSVLYDGELTYEDGKLTGLMLRHEIAKGFPEKDKTGYYLPFVIEVPGLRDDTVVTIEEDLTVTAKKENFDVKESSEGKNPGLVVLWSIPGENDERVITITVDLDGPDNKEYGPTTYTIDYTGLRLQQDSEGTIDSENLPEADVTYISSKYGYTKTKEDTYKLEKEENSNKYKLTGNIVYQTINEGIFSSEEMTGYYFLFNVGVDEEYYNKATVTFPGDDDTKTSPITDETGVTILFSLKKDKKDSIKITIDLDGDGKEYYPTTYEIDLTEVKFQKSSEFTVTGLTGEDKFTGEDGWYDTEDGYSVNVTKDENDKTLYHVSGLLPIVDDKDWSDKEFEDTYLHYLGLLLKLTDKEISSDGSINVKFFHNDTNDSNFIEATGEDFDSKKELYILKALSATDDTKKFTITFYLDFEADGYAPYTVTIDWSDLVLQAESNGDFGNYEVLNTSELGADTPEKTELNSYDYKDIGAQDVQLHMDSDSQPDRDEPVKAGLEGVIREQTLGEGAGFAEEKGYYVPIKVSYPGAGIEGMEKWSNSWTLILNTDDGKTKEYKPTSAEYAQGWVMVLFKVYRDGKTVDGSDNQKEITYQIDFDGLANYEFIPQKYSIKYDELTFESENEITYKYTGKDGKATEEKVTVYENETVDLKDMSEVNDDYRTFEKWTKEDNQDLDAEFKTNKDEDITLNAHWTIDVDKYITDAILVVNQKENVQNNFRIVKDADTFKVEILNKATSLSDITDTALAGAIAHALSFGDVESVKVKLGELEQEFKVSDNNYDESTIKTKVTEDLKTFFTTKVVESEEKTLDDLYTKWHDGTGLQLIVTPKENVAKIKDQTGALTYTITIEESSAHMVVQANSEDKYQVVNNKVLGTITKQDEHDKFMIPVIITNDGFNESSKITVTDPNNKETEYTYSESGLMTTSVSVPNKSVTLNLEALKASEITAEAGKKAYTIAIDLDGAEDGEADETYTIDYSEAETIEEKINRAAQNTQEAKSLTTTKDNKIKNGIEKFTYKYDTENGYTHYTSTDNQNEEQYSFKVKYLYPEHTADTRIVVSKKQGEEAVCDDKGNCKPEINGWVYDFTLSKVSKVTHELKLLQDVTDKENKKIRAISTVKKASSGEHTYEVTITKDAFNIWINGTYETGKMEEETETQKAVEEAEGDSITLTVELDDQEKYVKSIKTEKEFTVTVDGKEIKDNKMSVQYSNPDNTEIKEPTEFLKGSEEKEVTKDELIKFYQDGITYWEKHTGSQKYQG